MKFDWTYTYTVTDNVKPTASCVISVNITLQNGSANIIPSGINSGSNDNCTDPGSLRLLLSKSSFTCSDLGSNTVTLTVTDLAGNSSSCQTTVVVGPSITATAGPDITHIGTSFTMAANAPGTNETGTWSVVLPANFAISNIANIHSATTQVTNGLPNTNVVLRWTISNSASGCSASSDVKLFRQAVVLNVKAILAGAWNGSSMTTLLKGLVAFPKSSPYGGGETTTAAVLANNPVVDWVQVQLRTSVSTPLLSKGALMLSNGSIVSATDGISPLNLVQAPEIIT